MSENNDTGALVIGFVRTLAQLHPIFATIAQAWSEFEGQMQNKRVARLFELLDQDMLRVKDQIIAIEKDLIKSGDFPVIIERTVEKVRREASDEKIKTFSALLANCMAADESTTYEDKINFIETLDSLTDSDIRLLRIFGERKRLRVDSLDSPPHFNWSTGVKPAGGGEHLSMLIVSFSKLESRGLITESVEAGGAYASSGDMDHWINRWRLKSYEILPYGERFISVLA